MLLILYYSYYYSIILVSFSTKDDAGIWHGINQRTQESLKYLTNYSNLLRIWEIVIDLLVEDVEDHIQEVPVSKGQTRNFNAETAHDPVHRKNTTQKLS